MINQSQNIPPLSIPNILNYPRSNSSFQYNNFIIPPLINNANPNNTNTNNERIIINIVNYNDQNKAPPPTISTVSTQQQTFQNPTLIHYNPPNTNIPMTPLLSSVEEKYSSQNPDATNKHLQSHSKNHTTTPIKAKWTKEEDDILKNAISKYGTNNWSLISNEIQGRTGKQCRERWLNQLNPTLNKEHWLPHEDSILTHYQAFYGNSWSKISHFLPGRSPNSVKNRWSFLMRHNALQRARIWL